MSGTAVNFYTSTDDGVTWDILGAEQTHGATATWAGAATFIGALDTTEGFLGRVYYVRVRDDNGDLVTYPANLILQKPVRRLEGKEAESTQPE